MLRPVPLVLLSLVCAFTVTCARITVNVYFPAAEIRNAAEDIEHRVRQGESAPGDPVPGDPQAPDKKPQGSQVQPRSWIVEISWGVPSALAQNINITISTPAIRRLVAARQQRYPSLVPLFEAGALGENNRGLVEVRTTPGLSLQDRARANTLSGQENQDRQQLYAELAKANNINSDKVSEIATIFAEVNRQQSKKGWWIQDVKGAWKQK